MNIKEYRREEERQSAIDDLQAEKNKQNYRVKLIIEIDIETHEKQLAIENAFDFLENEDIYDYTKEIYINNKKEKNF